jgi:hypothetical protein
MRALEQHPASRIGFAGALLSALLCSGCVSAKYQRAPVTPQAAMNLRSAESDIEAVVQSVIIYRGPGSWKKDAYWDEYVVGLANHSKEDVTIESVALVDAIDQTQTPGTDPWVLEKESRENLKKYEHIGRRILVGVGLGVAWGASPALAIGGGLAGSSSVALLGVTTFFAIPAIVVTKVVVDKNARNSIKSEFDSRRLRMPIELPAGFTKNGSFFFPISPGPQRMLVRGTRASGPFSITVDLSALSGLHLLKQSAPPPLEPVKA